MRNIRKVHPEDFDVKQSERWCSEGKLFIVFNPDADSNAYEREVLDYVQRINAFATEKRKELEAFQPQHIVDDPEELKTLPKVYYRFIW